MGKITTTTIRDYAEMRGVSTAAVKAAVTQGKKLYAVSSYRQVGKTWLLDVDQEKAKKEKGSCVVA